MCGMHFHLVCNMNKFGRVLFIYILVFATTGAAEIKSKQSDTTTTRKPPIPLSRLKQDSTTRYKPSATTWRTPSSTTTKEATTATKWKYPTTMNWKYTTTTTVKPTTRAAAHAAVNHGVVAVASISGIDSRNGRLSSMNGIKIFPSPGSGMVKTDDKGNFIFKSVDGKMNTPITITKQGDGVSGTIRILPGSVSVSSSASSSSKTGPASAVASVNPWSSPSYMNPMMNEVYFPPFPTFPSIPDPIFDSRIPDASYQSRFPDPFQQIRILDPTYQTPIRDPWSNKASFRSRPPKDEIFNPNWYYQAFNPFIHFW